MDPTSEVVRRESSKAGFCHLNSLVAHLQAPALQETISATNAAC